MKKPKFDRVLGDGDCYLFRAGKAAEHMKYSIVDVDDYDKVLASSRDKRQLVAMLEEELDPDICAIVGDLEPEPFQNARANLRGIIRTVNEACGTDNTTIFVSDPSGESYRKALEPSYKAQRDPTDKPFWYPELRHYLLKRYDVREAYRGMEADDLLGIEQCNADDRTVIASVDKDLRQIPGWHYNIMHQELFHVSPEDADMFLWHQMLIGDVADNIKGIHGIGEVKAAKLLKDTTPETAQEIVYELYRKHRGPDWEEIFRINVQLLTILRSTT